MNTEEILSLPTLDRLKYINSVNDTFGFLKKLKSEKSELPSELESLFKRLEKLNIFNESKLSWCEKYPDFGEIFRIMDLYLKSEILVEFGEKSLPESLLNQALEVFKKTISFKTSSTDKKLTKGLTNSRYRYYNYCISKEIASSFQDEFLDWGIEISNLWNEIYYTKEDFFNDTGYDRTSWETYIKYPNMLERKKDELKKQSEKAFALMASGLELIEKHNTIITEEYKNNAVEMSLYERELEISLMVELENGNDEQYCYVYTLECELFVFYVGIASNPKERFEQHIRGAFSNESHLFKSKFIQKYNNELKQNIVYEGIRRNCKLFEKEYIAIHNPLGNMTQGGEG
tara:strand:- start:378 stop:1412 length:1035 start_codon:yes stop_codon:yes gene_type:complete